MAHRIEQNDQQQGIQQAWHGLTKIKPVITLEDNWLTEWDVQPILLEKRGKPSKWAVLECSDIPDVEIGQPYNPETFKPVDNKSFLELVRASIAGTSHEIVSVGSVRNRGRVFVSTKLNGMEAFVAGGRSFSAYLNFGNGHDKSSVLWVNTSNTCTVCDNTFSSNLFSVENKHSDNSDDIRIRQRHTKNAIMRLPEMAKLIDKAIGVQAEFQLEFQKLSQVPLSSPVATNLFAGFLGRRITDAKTVEKGLSTRANNTILQLVNLYESDKGNGGSTRADAFSAVTDYYTHYSSGKDTNPMRQFLSSEYGSGQQSKADFWRLVTRDDDDESFNGCVDLGKQLLANTTA